MNDNFDDHVKILKKMLQVDPEIKKEDEARGIIKEHGGSICTRGAYIYENNRNIVAVIDVNRIGTLAHEMRHAWQYKNKDEYGFNYDLPKGKIKKIVNSITYFVSEKELDAHKFAFSYCNKSGLRKCAVCFFLNVCAIWFLRIFSLIIFSLAILLLVLMPF